MRAARVLSASAPINRIDSAAYIRRARLPGVKRADMRLRAICCATRAAQDMRRYDKPGGAPRQQRATRHYSSPRFGFHLFSPRPCLRPCRFHDIFAFDDVFISVTPPILPFSMISPPFSLVSSRCRRRHHRRHRLIPSPIFFAGYERCGAARVRGSASAATGAAARRHMRTPGDNASRAQSKKMRQCLRLSDAAAIIFTPVY